MKIVFTGGGSGGHFYPLIAIAESVKSEIITQNIVDAKMYYIADKPYDEEALFVNELEFISIPTGKLRLYFSVQNFFDIFKTAGAIVKALFVLYKIYPDVVISKGGYPAFPVVIAAWVLRIPVIIHESDMAAGRVNQISAKFAKRIAVSFPDAVNLFKREDVTAWTGQPIRKDLWEVQSEGTDSFLKLERGIPLIVIYGGSQGSAIINDAIIGIIDELVEDYQVIHQVGIENQKEVELLADFKLKDSRFKDRYKTFGFFNALTLKMLGGSADLFISRGGAGSIFDMAMWSMPVIIIPITNSNGDHQRKNAYAYASTGGALVIEEKNIKPHVLLAEIRRIMQDPELRKQMAKSGSSFIQKDAADIIAKEALSIALSH